MNLFSPAHEVIRGTVKKIVFNNPENAYTVLRMAVEETHGLTTVVGNLLSIQVGEELLLRGEWSDNPKFGRQFQVQSYERNAPSTLEGMRRYLASMIKGVGPKRAELIVEHFGLDTLRIIEEEPERIHEVQGISAVRAKDIHEAQKKHKAIKEVMVFLQGYGLSDKFAQKIYQRYAQQSIALIRENPYRLAQDITGIGFEKADELAQQMGVEKDSVFRAEAAIVHALTECSKQGHVYMPGDDLKEAVSQMEVPESQFMWALARLQARERDGLLIEPLEDGELAISLGKLGKSEMGIARWVQRKLQENPPFTSSKMERVLTAFEKSAGLHLAEQQKAAVLRSLRASFSIITGGPGTGKTTIIKAICECKQVQNETILLAAPTGRAAKRMQEATGYDAKTIHRLLEPSPGRADGPFKRGRDNPLKGDLLIVDEASMIDVYLCFQLIRAIPEGMQVIFVGDIDQLPSVGPGNLLRDLIQSNCVPVTRLKDIFRQSEEALIVENAHLINQGIVPTYPRRYEKNKRLDFYVFEKPLSGGLPLIVELVRQRIPRHFGFDPFKDVQVLAPMHKGPVGVQQLNLALQQSLNPNPPLLKTPLNSFALGDRVLQTRNDYDKDVFNGDIGRVEGASADGSQLIVRYDENVVTYERGELVDLTLAYALSVHKSQGSEYPVVILPLYANHWRMLQRNLFYTAITRAKQLAIVICEPRALRQAVVNDEILTRHSRLDWRIQHESGQLPSAYQIMGVEQ